jgi:hypothetical protein
VTSSDHTCGTITTLGTYHQNFLVSRHLQADRPIRDNPQMSSEPSNRHGPVHFRNSGPLDIPELTPGYPNLSKPGTLPCPRGTQAKAFLCTLDCRLE